MKKLLLSVVSLFAITFSSPTAFAQGSATYVSDSTQLISAIESAEENSLIILNNDITLDQKLTLNKSISLDLNKHKITIPENYFIECGKKELLTPDSKEYKYYNDIEVTIKNGDIKKAKGKNGLDILNSDNVMATKPTDVNNGHASSPNFSIMATSGILNLNHITIYGGDGGNGGNGTYVKDIHFLFSGSGSNGGNGGDGADIFHTDMGNIYISDSSLTPGVGGKGGHGGNPNPNYWIWSGLKGSDGDDGKDGSIIDDPAKLYYR